MSVEIKLYAHGEAEQAVINAALIELQRIRDAQLAEEKARWEKARAAYGEESVLEPQPVVTSPTKQRAAKPSAKEKARAATKKAAPKAEAAPEAEAVPDEAAVRNALRRLIEKQGAAAAHAVLTAFGAARASDVPEDRRGEFIQQCQQQEGTE